MLRNLRHPLVSAVTFALVLALSACGQQSAPTAAAPPAAAAPAVPAPAPAAAPAVAPAATTAVADSLGVPECDDYLTKYQACVASKVPEAARSALAQSLDQTRAAWRSALATPGARDSMAAACKQAREATKASMAAYGCTDF